MDRLCLEQLRDLLLARDRLIGPASQAHLDKQPRETLLAPVLLLLLDGRKRLLRALDRDAKLG